MFFMSCHPRLEHIHSTLRILSRFYLSFIVLIRIDLFLRIDQYLYTRWTCPELIIGLGLFAQSHSTEFLRRRALWLKSLSKSIFYYSSDSSRIKKGQTQNLSFIFVLKRDSVKVDRGSRLVFYSQTNVLAQLWIAVLSLHLWTEMFDFRCFIYFYCACPLFNEQYAFLSP